MKQGQLQTSADKLIARRQGVKNIFALSGSGPVAPDMLAGTPCGRATAGARRAGLSAPRAERWLKKYGGRQT